MQDLLPWLTLKSVPGIGNLLFKRLMDHFGSPVAVLAAAPAALARVEGMTPRLAKAIARQQTPDWAEKEIESAAQKGYRIIAQQHTEYPALLHQIPDPPPVLYIYGSLASATTPVAVVGSRKATSYGRTTTQRLSEQMTRRGMTVVSGMARGIDTAAHVGALKGGGPTVAVLGSGLARVYPAENLKLFHQIAENGGVITEFAMNAEPETHHFPKRNRIISGMTLGTVVVEAARRSGSLITARLAAEQNREVFAVPGNIHAPTARGTHDLIKQGAKLVEDVDDIVEEIAPQLAGYAFEQRVDKPLPALTEEEALVLDLIGAYPVHIDALVRRSGHHIGALTGVLSQLELKGIIQQEPGKYFARHHDYDRTPEAQKEA